MPSRLAHGQCDISLLSGVTQCIFHRIVWVSRNISFHYNLSPILMVWDLVQHQPKKTTDLFSHSAHICMYIIVCVSDTKSRHCDGRWQKSESCYWCRADRRRIYHGTYHMTCCLLPFLIFCCYFSDGSMCQSKLATCHLCRDRNRGGFGKWIV